MSADQVAPGRGATTAPALSTFAFSPSEALTINLRAMLRNGEPWFIALDVASALGYSDAFEMTKRLDDDQRQNLQIAGFGNRGVAVINESGLYDAIFGSHKSEAKLFRRWVTNSVLPTIRKQGAYVQGADKLSPEAQDIFYAAIRSMLMEALRRYDRETEHAHWRSAARRSQWFRLSAEKVSKEVGLPLHVVIAAGSQGVEAGMLMMSQAPR